LRLRYVPNLQGKQHGNEARLYNDRLFYQRHTFTLHKPAVADEGHQVTGEK